MLEKKREIIRNKEKKLGRVSKQLVELFPCAAYRFPSVMQQVRQSFLPVIFDLQYARLNCSLMDHLSLQQILCFTSRFPPVPFGSSFPLFYFLFYFFVVQLGWSCVRLFLYWLQIIQRHVVYNRPTLFLVVCGDDFSMH